jgi:hypothetical protein
MTGALVGLVVLAVVVVAVVVVLQRSRSTATTAAPGDPLRKDSRGIDPRRIKVGDVIAHEGRDFLVRGSLTFDQDGFVWHEHHLDDTAVRRWLSVEDDEELELCLWTAVSAPALAPGDPEVTWDGVAYTREEHGQARFTAAGSTGTGPEGAVEYYDYAAGEKRLSFERYGTAGDWEVAVGEVVNERALDIYPSAPPIP